MGRSQGGGAFTGAREWYSGGGKPVGMDAVKHSAAFLEQDDSGEAAACTWDWAWAWAVGPSRLVRLRASAAPCRAGCSRLAAVWVSGLLPPSLPTRPCRLAVQWWPACTRC